MGTLVSALKMVPQSQRGSTQWLGTTITGVDQYLQRAELYGHLGAGAAGAACQPDSGGHGWASKAEK